MKIAALFTVFNGLELLEHSVKAIGNNVDNVIVCYQNTSNKGEINPYVGDYCANLGLDCIEFEPDLTKNTKENERIKHDFMIQEAKKRGYTHVILMATDHFYTPEQIEFAKKDVIDNDWDVTATAMFTYYKHPTWRLEPIEDYSMPFIIALRPETMIERISSFPWLVDPSVQVNTCQRSRLYTENEVMLHHYSMVRIDIEDKFRNAAASIRWKPEQVERFISEFENAELGSEISYFKGRKLVECRDLFGLITNN